MEARTRKEGTKGERVVKGCRIELHAIRRNRSFPGTLYLLRVTSFVSPCARVRVCGALPRRICRSLREMYIRLIRARKFYSIRITVILLPRIIDTVTSEVIRRYSLQILFRCAHSRYFQTNRAHVFSFQLIYFDLNFSWWTILYLQLQKKLFFIHRQYFFFTIVKFAILHLFFSKYVTRL